MRTATNVIFDHDERRVFNLAKLAAYVGFPNPATDGKHRNADADAHAYLNRASVKNEQWNHPQLQGLRATLTAIVEVLERECTREHWQELASYEKVPTGGVPLIANADTMIDVLTEARGHMLDNVAEALDLANKALRLAHPFDPED